MLRTNIRNLVRQTQLPKWKPLLPLFEAIMNSFQAIHAISAKGRIRIIIERELTLLSEQEGLPTSFTIIDKWNWTQ